MRLIKYIIGILLFCTMIAGQQAQAAEHDTNNTFSPPDAIPGLASSAVNAILIMQADQLYQMLGLNSTAARTTIVNTLIEPDNFIENQFVQKNKNYTAYWYIIFYIIFLFVGGIGVMKESATPNQGFGISSEGSWRNTYITIAILAPLVWAFYLYGLKWFFSLEYVVSKGVFIQTIDFIPEVIPNATAYFVIGLLKLFLIVFLAIRYLIIGLIVAFFLLIAAAWLFPWTKGFAEMTLKYGALMLFSRFIMALIMFGGIGLMQDSTLKYLSIVGYFAILIVDILFAIGCLLFPIFYMLFRSPIRYIRIIR